MPHNVVAASAPTCAVCPALMGAIGFFREGNFYVLKDVDQLADEERAQVPGARAHVCGMAKRDGANATVRGGEVGTETEARNARTLRTFHEGRE